MLGKATNEDCRNQHKCKILLRLLEAGEIQLRLQAKPVANRDKRLGAPAQDTTSVSADETAMIPYILGIGRNQLTEGVPPRFNYLLYSGYAKFGADTKDLFDDEALASLAWQAYEEMFFDYRQLRDACNINNVALYTPMPTLMAVIAIGNETFFSSQLMGTGAGSFVYTYAPDVDITNQLNLCQAYLRSEADPGVPNAKPQHRTSVCAEIFAVAMYMKHHNNQPPRVATAGDQGRKARVVVWGNNLSLDKSRTFLIAPCGPGSSQVDWGCSAFMTYQGINVVSIPKFGRYPRSKEGYPNLPINQVAPIEVRNQGVPLVNVLAASNFEDAPDFE
ncbi:MAG: hypothetical protein Q9209_003626 [Squamulea sp. 1 TL-2023]